MIYNLILRFLQHCLSHRPMEEIMNKNDTITRSFRIKKDILEEVSDEVLEKANCRTVNEYAGDAIRFYTSYLKASEHQMFLSRELTAALDGRLNVNESRIEGMLYKNTVMITAITYCLAATGFLNITNFNAVLRRAEEDVKGLNGYIDFDKIFYTVTGR